MQSFSRTHVLLAGVALLMVVLGFMVAKSGNTSSLAQPQETTVAAVRRGGLREAAKAKGQYVSSQRTTGWLKYDLESLTENSAIVAIGTPIAATSSIAGSGDRIVTEYRVRIDQTFKGTLKAKSVISMITPGGKVTFEDGTSAEITTPDLGPIEEYKSYVLFLKPGDEAPDTFGLVGGGQGLFELSDAAVKPAGDSVDVVQKYRNRPVSEFLEEIRNAVKKYPETKQCCS